MKVMIAFAFAALVFITPATAQYFSPGWSPGQAVPTAAPSPSSFQPVTGSLPSPREGEPRFSLSNILSTGPVSQLFGSLGLNVTERLENYNDVITNEELTEEEAKNRVWFLIITGSLAQASRISIFADNQFDEAYNTTIIEGDLPHVRWGRIDYMNVTYITTKWAIWHVPILVAVTERGNTLRFWRATQVRLRADLIREFLKSGMWEDTPPWQTNFAPGGNWEFLMEWQAIFMTKYYNTIGVLPRWVLYIMTGVLGSLIMNLFHRGGKPKPTKTEPAPPSGSTSTAIAPATSDATPVKGKGKKGKKSQLR
ncbi:hypothetical protein BGW80DRAFT_1283711 [Lactifluus volemus]|nr:hypothetical protein BGW80DRAFT_1283711 [Lactifluus volemus]